MFRTSSTPAEGSCTPTHWSFRTGSPTPPSGWPLCPWVSCWRSSTRRRRPETQRSENPEAAMAKSDDVQRNTFRENSIHVGSGFVAREREHVVEVLSSLGPHLRRWDPSDVHLEVSLQDRDGKEQRVTLRTSLPGHQPLIAVAVNPD